MKGLILLGCFKSSYKYDIYQNSNYGYEININTNLDEDFNNLISNYYDMDKSINKDINIYDNNPKKIKFLQECQKHKLELLQNAEYVCFEFNLSKSAKYIKQNPILKSKKIIFYDTLDSQSIAKYIHYFGNDTENFYFNLYGNYQLISFKEYQNTVNKIEDIVSEIETFNFSPLEKIMYVYDLVRDRIYKEVDKKEDKSISRDLSSTLFGDKIVCVGYATIFLTLLKKLNIKCNNITLNNNKKNKGHARVEIYIKDKKYNVKGVYYFDPTWDCKKKENDNSFLFSYRFFGMTINKMNEIDKGILNYSNIPYFSMNMVELLDKLWKEKGINRIPKNLLKSVNYMYKLIKGKTLINPLFIMKKSPFYKKIDREETILNFKKIIKYFNKPLPADILLQVLYNVRKIQYYKDSLKYPFDLEDFFKTLVISNWKFKGNKLENSLLESKSPNLTNKIKLIQFQFYGNEELFKNIGQVRLAYTLRKVYELQKNKNL